MIEHIELTDQQELGLKIGLSMGMIAGAGSGKTRVLTERFIEILEEHRREGLSPEKAVQLPVAITFTRKAAAEMAGRIAERCEELATDGRENGDFWHEVAMRMSEAAVGTIDSFCGKIVRRYPFTSRIDPTAEITPMRKGTIETLAAGFCQAITGNESEMRDIASRIAELAGWWKIPDALATAFNERGRAGRALENTPLDSAAILNRWRSAIEKIGEMWNRKSREDVVEKLRGLLEMASVVDPDDKLASFILQIEDCIPNPSDPKSFRCAAEFFTTKSGEGRRFSRKGSKTKWPSDLLQTARTESAEVAAILATVLPFIPRETSEIDENDAETTALFAALFRPFAKEAAERLGESGTFDFVDTIIGAWEIVSSEESAADIGSNIGAILVDEFQDTDPMQWKIISRLAEFSSGRLFWVGDPKQSIYAFRGADVSNVSKGKRWVKSKSGEVNKLSRNFRTTANVLRFTNRLGEALFPKDSPMDFDFLAPPQPLQFSRKLPDDFDGSIDILIAEDKDDEVEMIARRILTAVNGDGDRLRIDDGGTLRDARWGDIAVLLPTRGLLAKLKAALLARDIPHIEIGGQGFYSTDEIRYCIDLLLYASDPRDALSLTDLLRGPIFALPDTIVYAASIAGEGDIRSGLDAIAESGDLVRGGDALSPEEIAIASKAATMLDVLERDAASLPPSELLSTTLLRNGAWASFRALVNGKQRIANIEKLIEICATFDDRGLSPLADFLREERLSDQPEREASIEHEGTNTVRIMTIHQSKGLEFPIVIVADLGKSLRSGGSGLFRWDPIVGPFIASRKANDSEKGAVGTAISGLESARNDAEHRRLLYVAATRARDHLIFSSSKWKSGYMKYITDGLGLQEPSEKKQEILVEEAKLRILRGPSSIEATPVEQRQKVEETIFHALRGRELPSVKLPADLMSVPARGGAWFIRATDLAKIGKSPRKALLERIADLDRSSDGRGAQWGTIVHSFLQKMPCPVPPKAALEALAERELAVHHREFEDTKILVELAENDTVRRLFAVPKIDYREERVIVREGNLVIAGVIDRLWKDSRGWHIVDYKSDAVLGDNRAKRLQRYAPQLAIYRRAAAKALGIEETSIETSILFTHKIPQLVPIPEIDLDRYIDAALDASRAVER